jgi:hypothetical protein
VRQDSNSGETTTRRSRWQWLKDAFSTDPDQEKLREDEIVFLDRIASFIVRRGMTTPAIMLLESVRPLNYIGSQAMAFFEPVVKILYPNKQYSEFQHILEKRQSIETLLQRIEQKESERMGASRSGSGQPVAKNPPSPSSDAPDAAHTAAGDSDDAAAEAATNEVQKIR